MVNLNNQAKLVGHFKPNDPIRPDIIAANWGSRPYEYAWAMDVVDWEENKTSVIDFGSGLPSQYVFPAKVLGDKSPILYTAIDSDPRLVDEIAQYQHHKVDGLEYRCASFEVLPCLSSVVPESYDVAFCLSVLEHLTESQLYSAEECFELYLKNDGILVVTMDELWNIHNENHPEPTKWNELEKELIANGKFVQPGHSFGMTEMIDMLSDKFVPVVDKETCKQALDKVNAETAFLHSTDWNCCVSYCVFRKKRK